MKNRLSSNLYKQLGAAMLLVGGICVAPVTALAQTGVDDDRVSLPEGPGSLEGVGDNVEIDPNMGSMSYAIPISAPTGRNGMTPEVGLSYSSSGSAGVVGVGWSMPMPMISRMTSRGVPDYDAEDYFAFGGGDELVLTGSEGADLIFRSRFEKAFRRHKWIAPGDGAAGHWEVEFPDGSIGYYGATQDGAAVPSARLQDEQGRVAEYRLVEKVDPFGNRVLYEYDAKSSNVPLLSQVSYLFVDGEPLYTISLSYEERPDAISDANVGFETVLAHRLSNITMHTRNETIREYELTYEDEGASGGLTRLATVRSFGLGGKAGGGLENPIAFSFDYQKGLGADCEGSCDKPYLVDMGSVGVGLASGKATLVDINGDALPDVLDSSQLGNHRFILNELTANEDGSFDHVFGASFSSAIDQSSSFPLGDKVQTMDVNGDGYSDLINTSTGAFLLKDPAADDWLVPGATIDAEELRNVDFSAARFFDYNNDKKIDVLVSTMGSTQILANDGEAFDTVTSGVDALGIAFDAGNTQMADINGDGMSEPVELLASTGLFRYRLNLGKGKFADWRSISGDPIATSERDIVDLEDLNGDGRDDVVIMVGNQVKYALNRGTYFDPFTVVENIDGGIPAREDGVSVLYADMNANGSEDIVWFSSNGNVKYLELFPQRPNLLSRADNGLGFVQKITYSTAAEQAAIAARDGQPWEHPLQIPMPVVVRNDNFVTLTGDESGGGLHDVVTYSYANGFYDGVEKQYRGFSDVVTSLQGSDSQEEGRTMLRFDLGREDVYFNGLKTWSATWSGERELMQTSDTYSRCPLDASVPSEDALEGMGRFPVVHVCLTQTETITKEGMSDAGAWKTSRTTFEHDDFGNVTKSHDEGILDVDGDEMVSEVEYNQPEAGAWFVGLPLREQMYVDPAGDRTDVRYYYDGDDFVGSQEEITHGFLSRKTTQADRDTLITSLRQRRDEHGNVIESIDPLGSPEDTSAHRRSYDYDSFGLFIARTRLHNVNAQGVAYDLRRDSRHDYRFQKTNYMTDWILAVDDVEMTSRNETELTYDGLGREITRSRPGDPDGKPSVEISYDLGEPFSSIRARTRSEVGGEFDREAVQCLDGRGKLYQTRTRVASGAYLVTGFTVYNGRGAQVETYLPYESSSPDCEEAPPANVLSSKSRYDATFRPLQRTQPDEGIYGSESITRFEYEPYVEITYDQEDNLEGGVHAGTPIYRRIDGQMRVEEILRSWSEDGALQTASYKLFYDNTGSFVGFEDPKGNRHEMTVDWANRITQIKNANIGTLDLTYDAANNLIRRSDSRGITYEQSYDGLNRIISRHVVGMEDSTRVEWTYDMAPDCDLTECTQLASRLATVDYTMEGGLIGQRRYGYDLRDRVILNGVRFGDLDLVSKLSYSNQDELDALSFPDGSGYSIARDQADRVVGIPGFIDDVTYDAGGLLTGIDYANGAKTRLTFDDIRRPLTLSHQDAAGALLESYGFTRDRKGNLTAVMDESGREDLPSAALELTYDDWYRLTRIGTTHRDGDAEIIDYSYDTLDNVTSLVSSLEAASAVHVGELQYDAARPNQLTRAGDMDFEYDALGQMTRRGELELDWDHLGRITRAGEATYLYGPDQSQLGTLTENGLVLFGLDDFEIRDGVSISYVRLNGERVAKETSTAMMTQVYPDMIEDDEINAADAFSLAIAGAPGITPALAQAATPERILGASAARMLQEAGHAITYLQSDYLGSITIATDEGGELVGQRAFYPTGKVRWEDGFVDVYGFTGQEQMDSGLLRFEYRHLDVATARWASYDPDFVALEVAQMDELGEATTGYAYVSNNFANFVDPLGLGLDKPGNAKEKKSSEKKSNQRDRKNSDQSVVNDMKKEGIGSTPGGPGWKPAPPPGPPPGFKAQPADVVINMNNNTVQDNTRNRNSGPNPLLNDSGSNSANNSSAQQGSQLEYMFSIDASKKGMEKWQARTDAQMDKVIKGYKNDAKVFDSNTKALTGVALLIIGGAATALALDSGE